MKKRGLSDLKKRNRRVILQSILEKGRLSRVEIAQESSLAASTVSGLTSELLEEGILTEAGTVTTAGRNRTVLSLNPDYGSIAIIDIGRKQVCMHCFDLLIRPKKTAVLSKWFQSGNELMELIESSLCKAQKDLPPLLGIGLLFQEDMRESDFRVMYSTGLSSASITLREALVSRFRIPVEEQYSVSYTVNDALSSESNEAALNNAHISIGTRIMASITLDGNPVPVQDTFCEDMISAWKPEQEKNGVPEKFRLSAYLGNLISVLCILFHLNTVFLSSSEPVSEQSQKEIRKILSEKVAPDSIPHLRFLHLQTTSAATVLMAKKLVQQVILAC